MSVNKNVSLQVVIDNPVEGTSLTLKTVGDKVLVTADPGLYDPQELLTVVKDCIDFQKKLKTEASLQPPGETL